MCIDLNDVEVLTSLGVTDRQMAAHFHTTRSTITRLKRTRVFREALKRGLRLASSRAKAQFASACA